jgi:protein-export SecD/SecF family membrane protein
MKGINKATFFVVLLIACLAAVLAFFGLGDWVKGADDIRFGIDIRGGVEAIYIPEGIDREPTAEELESARNILEMRMDQLNILDREITIDKKNGEIVVQFPWKSGETDFKPQEAVAELGEMALLTFRDPAGNIIVEGKDVNGSEVITDSSGNYQVRLDFNDEATKAFADATARLVGQRISIYMDDVLVSDPIVQSVITDGGVINCYKNSEQAFDLSSKINSGALPFSLEAKNLFTVSPTLGSGALEVMVRAGIVSFILILLFMLLYYRLPGFVACIGLTIQLAGQILALSIPQITLTLPGIAGLILSIGMGVDANIIISERIKEEIKNGSTIGNAIIVGYKRAFSAVADGNITVVIVAILLMVFGSGPMLSFGYTLMTGVLLNFVAGIFASRLMVSSLSLYNGLRKPWMFGARRIGA